MESVNCVLLFGVILLLMADVVSAYEVVYAVNCGGGKHTDVNGIKYRKDDSSDGVASDYGKGLNIARVPLEDQVLYQTERYNNRDFSYDVVIPADGDYVLVLKFAEVYFQNPGEKVFDVLINGQAIINNLDIFAQVGRGVAYDEVVPFNIAKNVLTIRDESLEFDGTLVIEFAKGSRDNPKINAILVVKGNERELPQLPSMESVIEQQQKNKQEMNSEWGTSNEKKFKRTSGPRVIDPYSSDESWFWPITIAIAVFLPVLFCLCRVR